LENSAIPNLCRALAGGDSAIALTLESQVFAFQGLSRTPERPLLRLLPNAEEQLPRFRAALEAMGLYEEFEEKLGDLERILTTANERQLSIALQIALRLMPAILADARFVLLRAASMDRIEPPQRKKILAALQRQIVLLFLDDPSGALPEEATKVLVLSNSGVRGIGDTVWHEGLRREGHVKAPAWLVEARKSGIDGDLQMPGSLGDDDDDDDDD